MKYAFKFIWSILLGIDILFNFTVGSLIFWRRPYEWYFTQRLNKMRVSSSLWRRTLAGAFCRALNKWPFDRNHCNKHLRMT